MSEIENPEKRFAEPATVAELLMLVTLSNKCLSQIIKYMIADWKTPNEDEKGKAIEESLSIMTQLTNLATKLAEQPAMEGKK